MGLLDNALRGFGYERQDGDGAQEKSVEKAAEMSTGSQAWFDIFGSQSSTPTFTNFNNMKQQLQSYTDWVYAAAHTIAEQSAGIELRVFMNRTKVKTATLSQKLVSESLDTKKEITKYRTTFDKELINKDGKLVKAQVPQLEEVADHPILNLLNSPNPYMTRFEFFEMTFLHLELTGNAFWAIMRDKDGQPEQLWPLMPQFMSVVPDKEKFIIGYVYNINSENVPFAPDDIIHHKYSNPGDLRMGLSTVMAAARAIDTDAHSADYNRKFFYNSAQPDAVLYTDSEIDEKVYKRLVSQWRDTYGGTANSHRTAILENGLKYTPRVLTQKDMDFLAGRNFNRDQILAIFGVPKGILGLDESMSRANLEAAQYGFMKGKIRPKMDRLCARITQDLAIQFDEKLIVSFTDPVPADKEFILKQKQISTANIPWRTPNEVRAEDGDDPIPGADYLYIPDNLMAMAEDPFEPRPEDQPAAAEEDTSKPNEEDEATDEEDKQSGSASPDDPATPPADGGATTTDNGKSVKPAKAQKSKKKDITHNDFSATRNQIADKFELRFLRASRVRFLDQKKEVLNNVRDRFGKSYKPTKTKITQQQKNNLNNLFDATASAAAWGAAFIPLYGNLSQEIGPAALEYANSHTDEDVDTSAFDAEAPNAQKFYTQRSSKISESIDDETDKQLKASLGEGIDAGESIAQLRDRVENIYGASSGYRAERIARTESVKATTWATRTAWDLSGVVQAQEWVAMPDACPLCASMNGKRLGVGPGQSYFSVGETVTGTDGSTMNVNYESIDGPPLHVNCRCDLRPVFS